MLLQYNPHSLQPDVINWEIVTPGVTDEDKKTNAMLEIFSLAVTSHLYANCWFFNFIEYLPGTPAVLLARLDASYSCFGKILLRFE